MSLERKDLPDYIRKVVESNGWHALQMHGPSVDAYGHETEDGTYYPPTDKKNLKLTALRSDGTHFQVNITFEKDEIEMDVLQKVATKIINGLLTLESFRTCECVVGTECEKHRG